MTARVHHADLFGTRQDKYDWLNSHDADSTHWRLLTANGPRYLFVPQNLSLQREYETFWAVEKAMPLSVLGFQSHRDHFATDLDKAVLKGRLQDMIDSRVSDSEFAQRHSVADNRDWNLAAARKKIRHDPGWESRLVTCLYRPFDYRACYFSDVAMDYPRRELVQHVLNRDNLTLNLCRQTKMSAWGHAVVADLPTPAVFVELKDGSTVFPLYLYPNGLLLDDSPWPAGKNGRKPNLASDFVETLVAQLALTFNPEGPGNLRKTFGPEDIFHYAYAIFHSPTYRTRYAAFLKTDFPRLPLTGDKALFAALVRLGRELAGLHLLESVPAPAARYPRQGDNVVRRVEYKAPTPESPGRVSINDEQYFDKVPPEVFAFHVGGYQVCEKWLKDRKGRTLSYDDIEHYRKMTEAVRQTLRLMAEIDQTIPGWPLA